MELCKSEIWSWSLWPTVKVKRRAWDLELEPGAWGLSGSLYR